ncbi:RidA family protein [[Collinsella] massiliensis]|uniref:Reactive intermediate/imine deaminase n=1 Tax=[Collinsella] massiliensis TaxID=1232426 RepID=A0A1Y3XVC7_9ACTN|nr:RidA family protein [[Collinsella] massiliensis]OUN87227.1 reactive intermediate/imine deaminase [[Collinsella] massiliensis]
MSKQAIIAAKAPAALGPYSSAVRAGDTLYLSGQLGIDPATGELAEGVEAQARQAMQNIAAVLEEAGASFDDVVKMTVLLADIDDFAAVNEVYGSFLAAPYPARSAFQVAAIPKGALVEIEAIAVL